MILRDEAGHPLGHEFVEIVEHRRGFPFDEVSGPPPSYSRALAATTRRT